MRFAQGGWGEAGGGERMRAGASRREGWGSVEEAAPEELSLGAGEGCPGRG